MSASITWGSGDTLATLAVKAPTGSAKKLFGSGGLDAGLGVQHELALESRVFLDLQLAEVLQGRATELPAARHSLLQEGVALRATFVVDPHNVVQHVYVTNLNVGRNPQDTLRVLDALQTDELCPCNRAVGGETLAA